MSDFKRLSAYTDVPCEWISVSTEPTAVSVAASRNDELDKLKAENAKLRDELDLCLKCEECEAMLDCDECLRADASQKERKRVDYENAKLRELVRDMRRAICCLVVLGDDYAGEHEDELCALDDRMSELGVEV